MANDVLSIDLDRHSAKAVVVRRRGRAAVISAAAEVQVKDGSDPREAVNAAVAACSELHGGKLPKLAVAVSPNARLFLCELQIPYSQACKLSDEKLRSTARWEVEPYLDFPAADGLYSILPLDPRDRATATGRAPNTTALQVCVASRENFEHVKQACRERGLTLQRLYGADTAFAFAGLETGDGTRTDMIVDVRQDSTVLAMKKGLGTPVFRSVPASMADDGVTPSGRADGLAHAIAEAVKEFVGDGERPERIVLTGPGALAPSGVPSSERGDGLPDRLTGYSGVPAVAWSTAATGGTVQGRSGSLGPQFASAIGAAMIELGLCGSTKLGVNDRIPAIEKLRSNLHLVPVALVAIAIPLVGIQYLSLRGETRAIERKVADLRAEKDGLQRQHDSVRSAEEQLAALRGDLAAVEEKTRFFERLAADSRLPVLELLDGLSRTIPDDVVITKIEQQPQRPGEFIVSGCGLKAGSISTFVPQIQALPWCEQVKLNMVSEVESSKAVLAGGMPDLVYSFTFSIRVRSEKNAE